MFTYDDILYKNLLDRLGGRDMLELMINARDFGYVHYNNRGLKFVFRVFENEPPRRAEFAPVIVNSTTQSYYAPATYKVQLIVETLGARSWELIKPYHNVILEHPNRLAKVFETLTKVAVTFP